MRTRRSPSPTTSVPHAESPTVAAHLGAALGPILDRLEVIVARLDRAAPTQGTHLTVAEFARCLGRSEYRVRAWIKEGRVAATKVAGIPRSRWLIARSELQRLLGTSAPVT